MILGQMAFIFAFGLAVSRVESQVWITRGVQNIPGLDDNDDRGF